ncbi:MAG: hypothetical protein GTN53_05715 [Candidatus Aminicenantes bacterium]|nr:hypothetical protein [Candidatus Aminicenantes bacterium]NIT21985.1 hypothetical protein [Candidatus Aminicenantes bacterium]
MKDINRIVKIQPVPQELHIHTTFSYDDSAVAAEQTVEFIAHWLNQHIARFVARELNIQEYLVFKSEK